MRALLLLLVSSPLLAQDLPVERLDKEAAPQGVSLNLDDKFSVQGGSIVNRVIMSSVTIHGDLVADSPTFVVDSANNRVGIGTASPTAGLHVTVATTIQSGGGDIVLSTNTSTNSLRISGSNGAVSFSGTVSGLWQILGSSSSSSNVGSLSVSGLSGGNAYRLYVNIKKVTAGDVGLRFNSDSGTVYKFAQNVVTEGSLSGNNGQINQTSIPLNWLSNDVADGDSLICQLVFETRAFGSNAVIHVTGNCSETSTGAGFEQNRVGGYYSNTDLASVQVVALTGNLVGYMVVEIANR